MCTATGCQPNCSWQIYQYTRSWKRRLFLDVTLCLWISISRRFERVLRSIFRAQRQKLEYSAFSLKLIAFNSIKPGTSSLRLYSVQNFADKMSAWCSTVVLAGTASLFRCNPFIAVYLHMRITALEFINGRVLRTLYSQSAAKADRQVVPWIIVDGTLLTPAIPGPVSWQWIFCTVLETVRCFTQWIQPLSLTFDQAVSGARRSEFIWRVRRQRWSLISLLSLVYNY
jgi:hypothetical protein